MTTTATLESSARQLVAGEDGAISVDVRNDSDIVEEYRVEMVGTPAAWATAEPAQVTLLPGQSSSISLHFRPPRNSSVLAGVYDYGVSVLPTERSEDVVVLEGTVELQPFTETIAELVPRTSHGRFGGRHRIAIDNRGNTPITVALTGSDRGDLLSFRFQQPGTTIAPGTAEFASVRMRPVRVMLRGVPATHPFTITVAPPEELEPELGIEPEEPAAGRFSPVDLEGTYLQEPVLPPWYLKALLALVLLVTGLLALWFWLIGPAVRSTARAAIQDQVQEVEANAQQAAQDAAAAGNAANTAQAASGDAADAAQRAEQVTGITRPQPTRVPFAQRLEVEAAPGDSESTPFVPENPDVPMELTDLVVSNPQGDFGRLRLELDDEVLFDMALENFRDTDYHFLTPIQVEVGETLQLAVSCRKPGAPPELTPRPDSCVASALLGGSYVVPPPPAQ